MPPSLDAAAPKTGISRSELIEKFARSLGEDKLAPISDDYSIPLDRFKKAALMLSPYTPIKDREPLPISATILIAEDDLALSEVCEDILLEASHRVMKAYTGGQVIELSNKPPLFDLILLDVNLPDLNGFQVAQVIRGNPLYEFTPLIFVTGRNAEEDRRKGFAAGGDDYLIKPFTAEILLRVIKQNLERQERERRRFRNFKTKVANLVLSHFGNAESIAEDSDRLYGELNRINLLAIKNGKPAIIPEKILALTLKIVERSKGLKVNNVKEQFERFLRNS